MINQKESRRLVFEDFLREVMLFTLPSIVNANDLLSAPPTTAGGTKSEETVTVVLSHAATVTELYGVSDAIECSTSIVCLLSVVDLSACSSQRRCRSNLRYQAFRISLL